jgi:DNA-binding helix-hairpin-helix protein with protein kinase domain
MSSRDIYDHLGRKISLGTKLGTGGEGSVFEILGNQDFVVKLYHKTPPARHDAKLRAMVALANVELSRVAAWPIATLHDRPGGTLVGLEMRRIKDFKEAHMLYSPAHRKTTFPHADWKFLVHTAANCAAAFETLHKSGVVIGDVNQSNVMVSPQGMIALIDCDSFQIQGKNQIFTCEVGVSLFTPPELQGKSFRSITRTENHDRFGLAVLIFHLLFMGRHPFSGRFGTQEMPIEKAIKEFRFPYGRCAGQSNMKPPVHALTVSAVSKELGDLFERAFGISGPNPNSRPSPSEWFNALKRFFGMLAPCPQDPGHLYPTHVKSCIWCELMNQGAPNFFISVSFVRGRGQIIQFDLGIVWARIDRVGRPRPTYNRPPILGGYAPTPWPRALLNQLPAELCWPSIITSPPSPPTPKLLPPKHRKRVVAPTSHHKALGFAALFFLCAVIPVIIIGALIGQAAGGQPAVGWAAGGGFVLLAIPFGLSWGLLEINRRKEEARINKEYEIERIQREALARKQLGDWKQDLASKQIDARRKFETAAREREKNVQAMKVEAARRRGLAQTAWLALEQLERAWNASASTLLSAFDLKKSTLVGLRDQHNQLTAQHIADREHLRERAREIQKEAFLDGQFISDHKIRDIGPTRKATLASYGIETALDISEGKIQQVPGFGPKFTRRLLSWRLEIERKFVFNASAGLPADQEQMIEQKYFQARRQIEIKLLSGEKELSEIVQKVNKEFELFMRQVVSEIAKVAQANADLTVVPQGC